MIHLYKAARWAAGLAAVSAVFSFGGLTVAQTPDAQAAQAKTTAAVALALSAQSMPQDQVAVGRRFVKAMNLETGLSQTLDGVFAPVRDQVLGGLPAGAPAPRKAAFVAALDEALADTKADILQKLVSGLARYYAARVELTPLTEMTEFYESPLGRRSVVSPQTMSEADKQALGEYALAHTAMLEILGAVPGSMDVTRAIMQQQGATMTATFKTRLCRSLKTRGVTGAACGGA
ncbi:hypothetical protein PMI01_03418 [Caulobacter sp. AP07]|uniref:DUF2059 domain-containing protein n=1 Tax=Caulobacter sp. AP07 TaxID=1144304 RepID=UPI000272255C|nr:DUF2059 domain-containing protein [Caulobacter sp. AP07]EJL28941.1 hypothetical protein PMI01_03418 [Caulobacter sp. AP07]